ncbi:MAG TPA: murein biosynthesis integral membrane protein MurJ [Fimbriimonas sp.]|nr:murein biosynthesis integral membrane protein MurJ [Fimbriimonas sp.]
MSATVAPTQAPKDSHAKSVARFAGIMSICLALSRILGMLRDSVMVSRFGAALDADTYRIAIQVPDMIFMLVAGGGLSSAFIPVFSDLIHKDKEKEAWKTFSVVVTVCSIVAVGLIGIAWLLTPAIVHYFSEGKDPAVIMPAIGMSRVMLPAQFAFLIGSVMLATLYSRKHFLAPGLAPNVYNLGIILGALILPIVMPRLGIASMAWGALIGAFIGNIFLPALTMATVGSHFKPSLDLSTPGVRTFFRLLLPVILGFSLPSMVNLITQKFASTYGSAGINNDLAMANNLMQAPLGIFGQGLALGVFPVLAEFVAIGRMDLYRQQVSKTLRTVLYLGIPSGALMLALAPLIVHVLYGYGRAAHDQENLNRIADSLRLYALGVFAWCMQPVLMRGFFSLHKTLKPVVIGTGMTVLFIALCAVSGQFSRNFLLIPIATDVAALLLAISLYFALQKDVGRLDSGGIVATILTCTVASAVGGGAAWGIMSLCGSTGKLAEILILAFAGVIGSWIYYFATKLMKVPETEYVSKSMGRLRHRFGMRS